METLYKPIFVFSKEIGELQKELAQEQFMLFRPFAVNVLNPKYERWNKEFNETYDSKIDEDDELKDYGGTKYCEFISNKTREALKPLNEKLYLLNWEFDCDEICDIIFRNKYDKDLTLTLELKPITKN